MFSVLKIEKSGMHKTEYVYKGHGKNPFIYFFTKQAWLLGDSHPKDSKIFELTALRQENDGFQNLHFFLIPEHC